MSGEGGPVADRPSRFETAPGACRDLDALSRDAAAQAVLGCDAPLAQAEELIAAVTGHSLRSVIAARVGQIVKGHCAEADDMLPIGWLPMEARHCFERVQAALRSDHRDLAEIRRLVAEGAAFALAGLDRLDRAMKAGER